MSAAELELYRPPSQQEWAQLAQTAKAIARTDFVPKAIRGNDGAVLATLLTGRELGIGPMQALREVYVIEGKPTMSAQLMVALIRRAGHRVRTIEATDQRALVRAWRVDEPGTPLDSEFTWADAQRAKLTSKEVWQKYPRAMLWSRAVTALGRREFSEVLCGVKYTPEEAASTGDDTGAGMEVVWGDPEPDPEVSDPGQGAAGSDPPHAGASVSPAAAARPVEAPGDAGQPPPGHDPAPAGTTTAGPEPGRRRSTDEQLLVDLEQVGEMGQLLAARIGELGLSASKAHAALIRDSRLGDLRTRDWIGKLAGWSPARLAVADEILTDLAAHTIEAGP